MNHFVYGLHCILVFGIPALFGWVLLRRVFREANVYALAGGTLVIGFVAFMAAVNELRYLFEMRLSVWFADKLLLCFALLLLLAGRSRVPRLRAPGCVDRSWKHALVVVGTLITAFYYGIPAFHGYLHDAWWYHYPAAVQIQNVERFPLPHVFAPDSPLYYHHGPDILAACWSFLLDVPVQTGFALNIAILAPCAFLLAFALIARLARNYWAALLAATLLMAAGNLRFLFFLTGKFTGAIGAMQALNSQTVQGLLQLIFTPSHALGMPLALTLLLLFRHVSSRLSWQLSAAFGLVLGTFTLVAEWYFLPLLCASTLILAYRSWRADAASRNRRSVRLSLAVLPALIAIFWGTFNNTYLSGTFGHFWMRYADINQQSQSRHVLASLKPLPLLPSPSPAGAAMVSTLPVEAVPAAVPAASPLKVPASDPLLGLVEQEPPSAPEAKMQQPTWSVPILIPLRLNLANFGRVPSWESAGSDGSSYVSIFSSAFLFEATPVLLLGIPIGLWLAWRRRVATVQLLAALAVLSVIPPLFLDWGYRSTDFLRFFTAAFSYAALFLGWWAGELWTRPTLGARILGGTVALACLISPIGLGIIGLIPGALDTVKQVASTASSLSDLSTTGNQPAKSASPTAVLTPAANPSSAPDFAEQTEARRAQAFEKLAIRTGDFMFPLAKGRERTVIIVPVDQIPPLELFPEWMKMATLSRLSLPVGRHWNDSPYAAYYRQAVTRLDSGALEALDAKWVIASNVFQKKFPGEVVRSLSDRSRFTPAATFRDGPYYMTVFKVHF